MADLAQSLPVPVTPRPRQVVCVMMGTFLLDFGLVFALGFFPNAISALTLAVLQKRHCPIPQCRTFLTTLPSVSADGGKRAKLPAGPIEPLVI